MTLNLILDVLIVALLVPTIIYAIILNARLGALRKNRDELARIIQSFNEATVRAESGIPRLRKAADEAGVVLADRVEKAQALRDDLAFMIERAEATADRLEGAVRSSRDQQPRAAAGRNASEGSIMPPSAATQRSSGGMGKNGLGMGATDSAATDSAATDSTKAARARPPLRASKVEDGDPLSGALGRGRRSGNTQNTASQNTGSIAPAASGNSDPTDERSEAERELLKALQSVR